MESPGVRVTFLVASLLAGGEGCDEGGIERVDADEAVPSRGESKFTTGDGIEALLSFVGN